MVDREIQHSPGRHSVISYKLFERKFKAEIKRKIEGQTDETATQGQPIRCGFCHATITYPGNQLERLGQHIHTFSNPSGLSFIIACYIRARCDAMGELTAEWCWFPGYRWQYALCHECHQHLGWRYQSNSGAESFFGLILERLVFDEEE